MELSRQEYPALLTTVSPTQAVGILNDRVAHIGKVNSEVANWLAERRRVEDLYVQGLRKLARPGGQSGSYGVFQTPWQGLLNSIEAVAESHDTLAKRIEVDVERPLREFTSKNREMQSITTMKGNLAALAKDFDDAQRKSDKLQSSGKADSSKIAASLAKVQEASGPWESQAPYVFESLQALDESRINHLRDALTQLQTHEMDILERSRNAATSTLELILNVNTAEEISSFVARNSEGSPSLQQTQRPGTATQSQSSRSFTNALGSLAPPDDAAPSREPTSPGPTAIKKQRTGGGLSGALGALAPTDLEDRQSEISSIAGSTQTPTKAKAVPPSPAKKSTFGGLKRLGTVIGRKNKDSSGLKGEKPAPPERKTKSRLNPLRRNSTLSDTHQRIPSPNASAVELGDSSAIQAPSEISRTTSIDQPESRPQTNGDSAQTASSEHLTNGSALQPTPTLQPRQMRPPSTILEEGAPSALDDITRAQQEADASADNGQHLNLDIRSSPIQEDSEAQNAALSNVANVLRTQAAPPTRKQGTIRGRRDVRNTIFVPSGTAPESAITMPDPPLFPSPPLGTHNSADDRATDTQSIRSAHSLTSLAPGVAHRHPELTLLGLNASIIETVSTSFQQGQIEKAIVTGEIALAYNGAASTGKEVVRLDNFAVLHKVAPNPQFIQQVAGRSGEYSLDLQAISKAQVGFKYQVHLEDNALAAHSPVLLTPLWKIEPHQASVILNYAWNAALPPSIEQVTLSNVVVIISIENAKASSCMSKPVGTFSAEKGSIYWKLGQVVLERHTPEQRVLARFATEGEAKPGTVEARWEISGETASGLGSKLGLSTKVDDTEKRDATPDPFSDEGVSDTAAGYKPVAVVRKLVSGKYQAN